MFYLNISWIAKSLQRSECPILTAEMWWKCSDLFWNRISTGSCSAVQFMPMRRQSFHFKDLSLLHQLNIWSPGKKEKAHSLLEQVHRLHERGVFCNCMDCLDIPIPQCFHAVPVKTDFVILNYSSGNSTFFPSVLVSLFTLAMKSKE